MVVEYFTIFVIYVTFMAFAAKRLLTYLHLFQQDEYDGGRFFGWMLAKKVFDKRLSLGLILASIGWYFLPPDLNFVINLVVVAMLAFTIYKERDPRYESKKKLAMTSRAKRIYFIALVLCALPPLLVLAVNAPWVFLIATHLIPLFMLLANGMLQPFELFVQSQYANEARAKLARVEPMVIGITGSFGKTSVKHILGHILQSHAPTLITPGSVNTPMGITRIIREQLQENHQYFIVEMGAYGPGSIERLCNLTPPDIGIISNVGHAHYERFRSLDTVSKTKFELAQAVIAREGKVIVGEKALGQAPAKKIYEEHLGKFIVCGKDGMGAVKIEGIEQTNTGLEVRTKWGEETHVLQAPLFGAHHGINMVLAYVTACNLGLEPMDVSEALKNTPQIPHRLEVRKGKNSSLLIDDAYNSNPVGFQSALDLMKALQIPGRRILVTPGMVELGSAHNDIHRQVGAMAASYCDIALVVNPERISTFVSAFKDQGTGSELMTFKTYKEAEQWVNDNVQQGDIVLLENDLPDLYEAVPKL